MKYGLLSYSTENLGDDIQSIAAAQFLPHVDSYIDRDRINQFVDDDDYKVVLNGWFMNEPSNWPPSSRIHPLITSFHISSEPNRKGEIPSKSMLQSKGIEYLQRHAPIGARDFHTLRLLQHHGIDSYFSACLTLTLNIPKVKRDENIIVVNDIPNTIIRQVRAQSKKHVIECSNNVTSVIDNNIRLDCAQSLLREYARASLVITSRLHCALPCLAFGTPVLFIETDRLLDRFEGLLDLLHVVDFKTALSYDGAFIDAKHTNKQCYLHYRQMLIDKVKCFVDDGG